jgi:hypothetical protein
MKIMRGLVGIVVVTVLAAACGTPAADDASGRGWLDGEPEWSGTGGGGSPDALEMRSAGGATADDGVPHDAELMPTPGGGGPLRAGSVDDNADFDRFVGYLDRVAGLGVPLREMDPRGRIVVEVTGTSGLPVAGAEVSVSRDGRSVTTIRTTADGTARFHPAFHGESADGSFELSVGAESVTADPGSTVRIQAGAEGGSPDPLAIDILFLLDATGSMGDEIDRLKTSIDSVAARIASIDPSPDVRLAMTLYRDEGDAFVTATYDFTSDVDAFRGELAMVVADGGGDYPEALDEGLAEALTAPAWRDPASTIQLVFLVADAPPQVGRQVPVPYPASAVDAIGRGIKIFPVASSESDDQAEAVFRQLAQATGARFVFLSYGAGGAATGGSTDIANTDYEELALDDLIVRLVGEELAALTGREFTAPSTSTTSTTRPDGQ